MPVWVERRSGQTPLFRPDNSPIHCQPTKSVRCGRPTVTSDKRRVTAEAERRGEGKVGGGGPLIAWDLARPPGRCDGSFSGKLFKKDQSTFAQIPCNPRTDMCVSPSKSRDPIAVQSGSILPHVSEHAVASRRPSLFVLYWHILCIATRVHGDLTIAVRSGMAVFSRQPLVACSLAPERIVMRNRRHCCERRQVPCSVWPKAAAWHLQSRYANPPLLCLLPLPRYCNRSTCNAVAGVCRRSHVTLVGTVYACGSTGI